MIIRKNIIIATLLSLFMLASFTECKKDETNVSNTPPITDGNFLNYAMEGAAPVSITNVSNLHVEYSTYYNRFIAIGFHQIECLQMFCPMLVGKHFINSFDNTGCVYYPDTSKMYANPLPYYAATANDSSINFIEIAQIDTSNKIIKGSFKAKLHYRRDINDPLPAKNITSGTFQLQYKITN